MKKKPSQYEGNKKIMDDEATYADKNTIVLIDLIVDIIVDTTLARSEEMEAQKENTLAPTQKKGK